MWHRCCCARGEICRRCLAQGAGPSSCCIWHAPWCPPKEVVFGARWCVSWAQQQPGSAGAALSSWWGWDMSMAATPARHRGCSSRAASPAKAPSLPGDSSVTDQLLHFHHLDFKPSPIPLSFFFFKCKYCEENHWSFSEQPGGASPQPPFAQPGMRARLTQQPRGLHAVSQGKQAFAECSAVGNKVHMEMN